MRQIWLLVGGLFLTLMLVGCSTPTLRSLKVSKIEDPTPFPCGLAQEPCTVVIKASVTDGQCVFTLPGSVHVMGAGQGDRTVVWVLDSQQAFYRFTFGSVKPVGANAGRWAGEFVRPARPRDTHYQVTDLRTPGSVDVPFDYQLEANVTSWFGGGETKACGVDPVIVNKG